jgi:hypothetical protein
MQTTDDRTYQGLLPLRTGRGGSGAERWKAIRLLGPMEAAPSSTSARASAGPALAVERSGAATASSIDFAWALQLGQATVPGAAGAR